MASVEIGGYELRFDTGSVFYTENFFSILGIPLSAELPMNIEKFREILKEYTEKNLYKTKSGSTNCTVSEFRKRCSLCANGSQK